MDKLLKLILKTPAVISFLCLVRGFKFPFLCAGYPNRITEPSVQLDLNVLNCRVHLVRGKSDSSSAAGRVGTSKGVQLARREKNNSTFDAFSVEICGSIYAPSDMHYTIVQISITDITDGDGCAKAVHSRVKKWQIEDGGVFCYNCDLGKLAGAKTILSDWTAVAQVQVDWLRFPRRGRRELQFSTSILSRETGYELACAKCTFTYENSELGYIDLQENIRRARTLAVALGFAVSAADNKLYDCEVELIKNWARANLGVSQTSGRAGRKLEKALNKTFAFFRDGNKIDVYKICKEIVEIVPVAERYDILDLCLHVAQANGVAAAEELALLKKLASWLEVDTNKFRSMVEKILPVNMHEVEDVEVILGVTSDMSREETRQRLNKEYCKWNARVTSFDPEIQAQADYMLKFIAEARSAYVG